jgi:fucose permease
MGGFFLLGGLIALLGGVLPVWIYYLHLDLATAGNYFFIFNLGVFAASMVSRVILGKLGLRRLLAAACLLVGLSLALVAVFLSPAAVIAPLVLLGFAAGLLTTGVSWLMAETVTAQRTATMVSLAGLFFGAGAFSLTLAIWATVHVLAPPGLVLLLAGFPMALSALYFRQQSLGEPALQAMPLRLPPGATRSPLAVMLSLALFFQSGSEWTVGGWLAIYWIRRLGVSLNTALIGTALYWAALTLGKLVSPRRPWAGGPFRLLAWSSGAALFGCLFLFSTVRVDGATVGTLLLGAGLGALYPPILAQVGERFPYYHPGFFNGFFSLSLVGGMLAPWVAGHLADVSVRWAIGVPALGVLMVFLLQLAILVEGRLSRATADQRVAGTADERR